MRSAPVPGPLPSFSVGSSPPRGPGAAGVGGCCRGALLALAGDRRVAAPAELRSWPPEEGMEQSRRWKRVSRVKGASHSVEKHRLTHGLISAPRVTLRNLFTTEPREVLSVPGSTVPLKSVGLMLFTV